MTLAIRTAEPADAAALAPLLDQLGYPAQPAEIAGRLERLAGATGFVALDDERVVALVTVSLHTTLATGVTAKIEGFVVERTYRSRGLGARLLERAERWARERGCPKIGLTSNAIRERAHAFYQNHGYAVVKTQLVFEKAL